VRARGSKSEVALTEGRREELPWGDLVGEVVVRR
jgi:hypothetical protein